MWEMNNDLASSPFLFDSMIKCFPGGDNDPMIIGFGFGNPLVSLLMLLATSFISYTIFKWLQSRRNNQQDEETRRNHLRQYYREQRERARQMMKEYDLTDEEIERRIDEELRKKWW